MKKYKLRLDLKLELGFVTLYRIQRLSDGELGGYVQSEQNLSQGPDDAWVYGNARVYDNASVYGNAWVCDKAKVYGNAIVFDNAKIYDRAIVSQNGKVYGYARVYDNVSVSDNARVYDGAIVQGNSLIFNNAEIFGYAMIFGAPWIRGNAKISRTSELVNFIIPSQFSVTITPDNIGIGCHLKKRSEWLKVTKDEAIKMGLAADSYDYYRQLIKLGMKMVPRRKKAEEHLKALKGLK